MQFNLVLLLIKDKGDKYKQGAEDILFNQWCWEIGQIHAKKKMKVDHLLIPYT